MNDYSLEELQEKTNKELIEIILKLLNLVKIYDTVMLKEEEQ